MSYLTSDATVDCKNGAHRIDENQKKICAIVIAEECNVTLANFYVAMTYEGLKFVSNDTMLQVV